MYTDSYSFNNDICLHIHSAECTVRLLNQAGRNNYPYNPKYVANTGNRTRDIWFDKCISNQQLYQLSYSTTLKPTELFHHTKGRCCRYSNSVLALFNRENGRSYETGLFDIVSTKILKTKW